MKTGTPTGLGQPCKGSLELELYRYTNITKFTQMGLNPFVNSEADAEEHWDRFTKAAKGYELNGWENL